MQPETMRSRWDMYINAWADISDEERQQLLKDSVAADCIYTDALAQCHGHAELTTHIQRFQRGLPGSRFETELFATHHNYALAGWHPVNANGTVQPSGVDAVIFNADGLLAQITGFPIALTK